MAPCNLYLHSSNACEGIGTVYNLDGTHGLAQTALQRVDKPLPVDSKILDLSHGNLRVEKALSDRVEKVILNVEQGYRLNNRLQSDRLVTLLTRRMQMTPEHYPFLDMNKVILSPSFF